MQKIAIIGTREPSNIATILENINKYIQDNHLSISEVRSGNAAGVDQLANEFRNIKDVKIKHFLPWSSYNKEFRIDHVNIQYIREIKDIFDKDILRLFPYMKDQNESIWLLIRRNFQIIMGENGDDPVDIVFWNTATGKPTGGTRYGVVLAEDKKIVTVNV